MARNASCSAPPHVPMTRDGAADLVARRRRGALAAVEASADGAAADGSAADGAVVAPPLEQAATTSTDATRPATSRRRRMNVSSIALSSFCPAIRPALRCGPAGPGAQAGRRTAPWRGAVEARTMSSVGRRVRRGDRPAGDPLEEGSPGRPPEVVGRQADGGQRRIEVGGQRDVVEADDRDVAGHAQARLAQAGDRADGDHVAGDEDGVGRSVRARISAIARWPLAASNAPSATRSGSSGEPGRRERRPVAGEPLGRRGVGQRGVGDAGDPPMAERQQVLDREPGAGLVVDVDARARPGPGSDPWITTGKPSRTSSTSSVVVVARAGHDQPVRPPGAEQVRVAARRRRERLDQHAMVGRPGRVGQAPQRLGQERVVGHLLGRLAEDQAEGAAGAAGQLASHRVRVVVELGPPRRARAAGSRRGS